MNPLRGINQDISPNELPEGFYSFAKNILLSSTFEAVENEQGFLDSSINSNGSYKGLLDAGMKPVGVISTTKFEVFWLTNNTRSVVGTYNQDLDTFTIVYDDDILPKLNLNLLYPLKAVWRENYLGEIYVAWTDRLNKPKILNLQKASQVNDIKDILLFPEFIQPAIEPIIQNAGSLTSGTYYGYIKYSTNDGKNTDYSLATTPIYISPDSQLNGVQDFFGANVVVTSKSILFRVSNIDTSYDKITLAIQRIKTGNDIKDFVEVSTTNIASNSTIDLIYTGGEQVTTLTSDEVLIKAPLYTRVETITTLNSQLFLGNLQTNEELNIQKYVNNWKVRWLTNELSGASLNQLPKYSTPKSFAHDEVYALYAVLQFKSGKLSQAFTIPGRAYTTVTVGSKTFNENAIIKPTDSLPTQVGYTGDTSYLDEDYSLNPSGNVRYFQTRDTCSWNGTYGTMGYWENETELYPDSEDYDVYDSTGKIGTLRNSKVRHHKFPSNSFIKDTIYPSDDQYGITKINRLGIKLEDVYLPDDILSKVDKIIICQAKRSFGNSLVIAQDKTSFMGFIYNSVETGEESVYDQWATLPITSFLTRTFRYNGDLRDRVYTPLPDIGTTPTQGTLPDYYRLKLHSPELLNSQPNLGNCYLKLNYRTARQPISSYSGLGAVPTECHHALLDFNTLTTTANSTVVSTSKKIIRVKNYKYTVPNQVNYGTPTNVHTDCLMFSEQGPIIDIPLKFGFSGIGDDLYIQGQLFVPNNEGSTTLHLESNGLNIDFAYHFNINKFYSNVYSSYTQQELIIVDKFDYSEKNTKTIYNADTFLDLYSFNTFGVTPNAGPNDSQHIADSGELSVRANYVHFIETSLNSGMRCTTYIGNRFSRGNSSYLIDDSILTNGNYVSIIPDYNHINEDIQSTIFETSESFVNTFPHRIVKSLSITSESKVQQWTDFLPLDYHEIDKSKGVIRNLQSYVDRLLIHTERALFVTRDKARLGSDTGDVNLTSGEIFDFPPQEVSPTINGFTGTQHMFSCALLNEGYFWVDAQSGKVFLYNFESLKEISNLGLYNFFAKNLGTFEDSPFNSNGITVTNDLRFNRLLLSVKNNNKLYTLSFQKDLNNGQGGWVSFHDYDSDCLLSSRKHTFSFKDGKLYVHNNPLVRGEFFNQERYSSFVDTVFNSQRNSVYLNSVEWNTDFSDINEVYSPDRTISHLTVRNQYQHSSRFKLDYSNLGIANDTNSRNAEFRWNCNTFRDLVNNKQLPFIKDIFNNFDEITTNINPNKPWFDQEQFNNRWFVIRLEYDNVDNYKMVLHSVDINRTNSYR